jgi:hypothetical protein
MHCGFRAEDIGEVPVWTTIENGLSAQMQPPIDDTTSVKLGQVGCGRVEHVAELVFGLAKCQRFLAASLRVRIVKVR